MEHFNGNFRDIDKVRAGGVNQTLFSVSVYFTETINRCDFELLFLC